MSQLTQSWNKGQIVSFVIRSSLKNKRVLIMFQALVFLLVSLDITLDIVEGLPVKAMIYDLLLEGSILVLVILSTKEFRITLPGKPTGEWTITPSSFSDFM